MPNARSLAALPLSLLFAAACGPRPVDTAECVDVEGLEGRQRWVAGETFYLPDIADTQACADVRWTVAERPEGSDEPIVRGRDGYWRITPTTPGDWRIELANVVTSEAEPAPMLWLNTVAAAERPFTNLNYYPSNSIAQVGDELWVANVQTPTITRLEPGTLAVLGEHPVGPWPVAIAWREGMDFAVVAHRGADTLGLVDVESGRLLDAIWVGDEPANVAVSSDGSVAYVALKSENAIAVVDLAKRVRSGLVDVVTDPLALALSADDATLYVASHRSGQPSRFPYGEDPLDAERDLAIVDTATLEVDRWWLNVGATITGLLLDPTDEVLYVSRTRNDTEASLGDPAAPSFLHEVARFDATTGDQLSFADLTRQASSGGHAVTLHDLALADGRLWVSAEGSDLAIGLNPTTLAEEARISTLGRPRGLAAIDDELYVHGAQAMTVTRIAGGLAAGTVTTAADPRPQLVAAGQRYFTGAGEDYGANWACNSCHADGLSDTLIWNAGPFSGRKVSRPFFWLEGTYPLGWDGYLSSVDNYAFTVNTNIGVRPTTAEYRALSAYLSSLMPPPPANGLTRRDGALSEEATRGAELFAGEAGCASCHPLPLTTNRALIPEGVSEGPTDVPGLIGTYRLGTWLKRGEATTLAAAIDHVTAAFGPELSADDKAAIERYLRELTARDLFVLSSSPRPGAASVAADEPLRLTFSMPIWRDPENLVYVTLHGPDGAEIELTRELDPDGRHITLSPTAPLTPGAAHTIRVDSNLEGFDERRLWVADADAPTPWEIPFTTAAAPALRLAGDYHWTIDMPLANPQTQEFDHEVVLPTLVPLVASETQSGAALTLDYGQDLILERVASVDGDVVVSPPLPIPIGPSFADSTGFQGSFVDLDDDGVGDYAEGTLTISGPGFLEADIAWRLTRPSAGECAEGAAGDVVVDLSYDGADQPVVDWGETPAVGLYVIDPDAQPPAGPGQLVTGGDVYWAIQLEALPDGFAGPVTYGELPPLAVDVTQDVGGAAPGAAALVSGQCYKVSLLTTEFLQGSFTFVMP